jgi:two-component system sensor histidine kinase FlrB
LAATAHNQESLRQAFDAFNRHSSVLEASYRELQGKVESLKSQLRLAQGARHRELIDKERIASRLARTLDVLPGAVIVIDGDGIIRECNAKASELLNRPLLGCAWFEIVQREFRTDKNPDSELRLRDGRWLSLSRRPLLSEPGEILLLADISESRRMAEMSQRRERLSTIGEMTASLAHQIRTPLASALLYTSQIPRQPSRVRELTDKLADRLQELGRMAEDLLNFARGARPSHELLAVAELLRDVIEEFESQDHYEKLEIVMAHENLQIAANRDAIKGALVNLVSNALQACGSDARVELGAERINGKVCLTVTDNGHGIAADIKTRLFEPFFTTRPQGTGLGLAVVHAVADAHDGEILVDSRPGMTSIAICLPAQEHKS